jgi:hypothetical protein
MISRYITILLFCIAFNSLLLAQTTTVTGRVFNGESGRPLPFVSVSFAGSSIGTMTDSDGHYEIVSEKKVSRINISFIGYQSQSIAIQKQVAQKIDIALEPKRIELAAAEVRPDKKKKNPAKPLMQRVANAKKQNDPSRIPAISFNYHERLELDLNDIPNKLPGRKFWGAFGWVWDNLDSLEARVNLPVFFTESSGTIRTQKKPRRVEKRVEAARATWLEDGQSTSSVTSEFLDINLYENQLLLMDKAFTSPLHDRGSLHYRYYLLDTLDVENRPTFHLAFVPRRRGEFTFEGEMWIDTLTLGLKKVEGKISEGANLNFIRSFNWQQDYELIENRWVQTRKEDIVDISPTGGGLGFYARSTMVNYDFEIAEEWPDSVWTSKRDLSFSEGSNEVLEEIWVEKRPEKLLSRESSIYHMVDSVTSMPQYNFLSGLLYGFGSGFVQLDKIELGPWYDSYSRNAVEGNRFSLGVQTSNDFSRKLWISLFGAYGSNDNEWKYGGDITWVQRKTPRIEWFGSYQKDIEQLGMMGFFDQGNVFNTALSLEGEQDQLSMITSSEASVLIESGSGLSTFVELRHRKVDPKGSLEFPLPQNPDGSESITTAESTLQLRYAHQEKFVSGAFERVSLGSRAPIVTLTTTQGWKGVAGSQFRYGRYTLGLEGKLRWGPLGRVEWTAEGGMYSGTAPFPLMELQPANETALSIQPAFNLLRYFEFVTDRWVRTGFEWHGEGAILGHLPLIRRLELREIIGAKAVYGSWDTRHEEYIALPETTTGLDGIYAEAVFGLENIFHFLRVDGHLRLTKTEEGMRKNFGIRVGLAIEL